jgi:hypothetical protein
MAWSVLYKIVSKTDQGSSIERHYVGNCLTRKERTKNFRDEQKLYYLFTQEVQGQNVVRRKNATRNEFLSPDHLERETLKISCYLAYDLPYLRDIIRKGSVNDKFERTVTLPEATKPDKVFFFSDVKLAPPEPTHRFPDGTTWP